MAYDWRAQHVKEFEEEILQNKKHGLEFFAFWRVHDEAFALFEKYKLHPQIWRTVPSPKADSQEARVAAAANALLPLVEHAKKLGCKLGLYNHGGWGGEPANLVAVCKYLHQQHHWTCDSNATIYRIGEPYQKKPAGYFPAGLNAKQKRFLLAIPVGISTWLCLSGRAG